MVRSLLIRGMLVGLVAGLLVFGFAKVFGEPQLDVAIAFEAAAEDARMATDAAKGIHDMPEEELVSRPMQASFGLLTGVMVYSTAFGGLFALVFAYANGRATDLGPRAVSALLALTGFTAFYLVPNLKYPANPPSVGQPDTIGMRTQLYFVMVAVSIAAMAVAAVLRRHLAPKLGVWEAALGAAAFYIVVVIATATILPSVNEVPPDFPATILWYFRLDSLAMQVIMWAALGLGFGALTERNFIAQGIYRPDRCSTPAWR